MLGEQHVKLRKVQGRQADSLKPDIPLPQEGLAQKVVEVVEQSRHHILILY